MKTKQKKNRMSLKIVKTHTSGFLDTRRDILGLFLLSVIHSIYLDLINLSLKTLRIKKNHETIIYGIFFFI